MSFAESLRTGFLIRQQLDSAADEADKRQAEVKLLKAQAEGMSATAQLNRQKFDQAVQHQTRLMQAFTQQEQRPEPLPGEQPQGAPPGPPSRLQQQLGPQEDVPPMPIYNRHSGPGVLPSPQQEAQGFTQRFQGPDEQGQLQAFARRYGPQVQPQAPVSTEQAAPVPQAATPAPGTVSSTPPVAPPTTLPGAPRSSSAVPQPGTVSSTPPVVTGPTLPQEEGAPASPQTREGASGPALDETQLLRNLSKAYFLANEPQVALALYRYGEEQAQLRNLARVYKDVMADPGASEPQRRIALAGLGAALVAAAHVDEGMKLLTDQLPLSARQVIEKASVDTRNVLLEQSQAGQPLDVAQANKEAQQRKNQAVLDTRVPREPRQPQTQVVETEQGVFVVDKATGQARQVTLPATPGSSPGATPSGTQPLPGKRMTGEQSKAFNYGSRALQANQLLDGLEAKGVTGQNFGAYLAEQGPVVGGALGTATAAILGIYTGGLGFGVLGAGAGIGAAAGIALSTPLANALRSPDEQLYAAAKLDFISSVLRKESGAAITKDEAAKEDRRYFAQSGDAPAVIAQKRQARLQVLATLSTEAGRPLMLPQPTPPPQTPADAGIIPTPGGGEGQVRVQRPQATPKREIPERLSSLLVQMSPETILGVSEAAIEGVTSPSDVPGLSVAQQRALLLRLQRRTQGR